jgi:hypothetical protein
LFFVPVKDEVELEGILDTKISNAGGDQISRLHQLTQATALA